MFEHSPDAQHGTLVAIGASLKDLQFIAQTKQFQNTLVVQAEQRLFIELEDHFRGNPDVQLVRAAVSKQNGTEQLHLYNFPGLHSIHPPSPQLHALMPGLRVRSTQTVQVLTPAEVLERCKDLAPVRSVWVQAYGSELPILDALEASPAFDTMEQLYLRSSVEPMFDLGSDAATLTARAENLDFVLERSDTGDADWILQDFRKDRRARELRSLRSVLTDVQETISQTREMIATRDDQIEALQTQLVDSQTTLAGSAQMAEERSAQIQTLQTQLADSQTTLASSAQMAEERGEQIQTLQTQLAENQAALTSTAQMAKDHGEQVQTLQTQLAENQTALASTEQMAKERGAQIQTLQAELTETQTTAQAAAQKAQSNLELALRSQVMVQSDLRALQVKFHDAEKIRQTQQELLGKLAPRLRQAMEQLRELTPSQDGTQNVSIALESLLSEDAEKIEAGSAPRNTPKQPAGEGA